MKVFTLLLFAALSFACCFGQVHRDEGDRLHKTAPHGHEKDDDIWANEDDHEWHTDEECTRCLIRRNQTKSLSPWKNITTVHLKDHHNHFRYNFTFSRSMCCYKVHFFSNDVIGQLKDDMTCEQRAQPRPRFYLLDLSPEITSTSQHWCKVFRDEKGRVNVTCGGILRFDPSNQRSNIWHVFASKCGSREGVEMTYSLNFTSEKDKCRWKKAMAEEKQAWYMNNTLGRAFRNATKEYDELHEQYPIAVDGMLTIAVFTGLNTLFILVGFTVVFVMLIKVKSQKKRGNEYASYNPEQKVPL